MKVLLKGYCVFYLGAVLYRYKPTARKSRFGSHTARSGDMAPLTENDVEKVEKTIYKELRANPIPRCKPIPPLTFLDERETPMSVMINAASGEANRL
jgi:hypothetical protein